MASFTSVSIVSFKGWQNKYFALRSMGFLSQDIKGVQGLQFIKLMGSGSGNGFGVWPEWGRYVMVAVWRSLADSEVFFKSNPYWLDYYKKCDNCDTFYLSCCSVHGSWSGAVPFEVCSNYNPQEPVAVITRATIKWSKMLLFWKYVPQVNKKLKSAYKPEIALGIGEWPFRFQATFSLWHDGKSMEKFAYKDTAHIDMIKKTKTIKWYEEELFARFHIIKK